MYEPALAHAIADHDTSPSAITWRESGLLKKQQDLLLGIQLKKDWVSHLCLLGQHSVNRLPLSQHFMFPQRPDSR